MSCQGLKFPPEAGITTGQTSPVRASSRTALRISLNPDAPRTTHGSRLLHARHDVRRVHNMLRCQQQHDSNWGGTNEPPLPQVHTRCAACLDTLGAAGERRASNAASLYKFKSTVRHGIRAESVRKSTGVTSHAASIDVTRAGTTRCAPSNA